MLAAIIDGTNLCYRFGGRPGGTTLVFVNSLGTDWRVWEAVAARFAGRCRLLFYDKRGHGLSGVSPEPLTIADHVQDLAGLLDALNVERPVVCGLSVGGMIALGLAGEQASRMRGLVLCDTGHRIGTAELWNARIDTVRRDGMDAVADGVMERWLSASFRSRYPAETALWRNMLVRTPAEGYAATCVAIRDADLTGAARSVAVPALCLCGTEDLATPPGLMRELAGLIPDARYRDVNGAAHLPTVENPDVVANLIEEYLQELNVV